MNGELILLANYSGRFAFFFFLMFSFLRKKSIDFSLCKRFHILSHVYKCFKQRLNELTLSPRKAAVGKTRLILEIC